ncbi:hypothetical protein AWB92_24835 [Mycobacterium sp. IEC1808]|nr:hypothetical protein AWB92_24835 [Mycobacterium sp. IEC1808]
MVSKIESGARNVTISEAAAIADSFGVTVDRLLARRARPASDRDFVLGQLAQASADGQRSVRVAIRDITDRLDDVSEIDPDGNLADLVAAVRTACDKLAAGSALLAQCGGTIAKHRGSRRRVLRVEWAEDGTDA